MRVFRQWQVFFMFICFAESAKFRSHDSVATAGNADMKLGRCVVEVKMQVQFEDGCYVYSASVALLPRIQNDNSN